MKPRQGAVSLLWLAIIVAAGMALGMAALFSMRQERNFFAEGWARLAGSAAVDTVARQSRQAVGGAQRALGAAGVIEHDGVMRQCRIGGKQVVSNVECDSHKQTSRVIALHDTRGIEPPKAPPPPAPPDAAELRARLIDQLAR
ncbi:MAG: DUF4124 domain-containing protein [Pseudomonadota bacterium]